MATRCFKPTHRQVQSSRSGSKLSFSSKQAEMFRQIAQNTRQSGLSGRTGKFAFALRQVFWRCFRVRDGTEKTMAVELIARELRTSLYRVNLNQVVEQIHW